MSRELEPFTKAVVQGILVAMTVTALLGYGIGLAVTHATDDKCARIFHKIEELEETND
jgi:hypothetical protein